MLKIYKVGKKKSNSSAGVTSVNQVPSLMRHKDYLHSGKQPIEEQGKSNETL